MLANLFMHYAFDAWLARTYQGVEFERYADDAVVHCVSERQAREVLTALADRMEQVGLRLHPDKTRIVYCKDGNRRGSFEHTSFTFLGFTFHARKINPIMRGWLQYYGAFHQSVLQPFLERINAYLVRWIRKKYKRLRPFRKANGAWQRTTRQYPRLFAHWAWTTHHW